jgi:hypothetical protein
MSTVVILGAGPLGGALACTLSWTSVCSEVILVDEAVSTAAGKALDIRQSCPIIGSDTRLTASANPADTARADVIVIADHAGDGHEIMGEAGLTLLGRAIEANPAAPVLLAGCAQEWLLEKTILELNRSRTTIVGSGVHAFEAGLRVLAAIEADRPAREVILTLVGRPPKRFAILWDTAIITQRAALDRLDAAAVRRLESRAVALWPPGPYALASSASLAVAAMLKGTERTMTCLVVPERAGEAVALPVTLGTTGIEAMATPSLDARAKLALGAAT